MDTQIRKRNKQRGFAMISLLLALPIFAYFLLTMQQKVEELQALSEYQETGVAMAEMVDAVAGFMVQELTPNMAYPDTTSGTAWLKSRSYLPADFRTNYGAQVIIYNNGGQVRVRVRDKTWGDVYNGPVFVGGKQFLAAWEGNHHTKIYVNLEDNVIRYEECRSYCSSSVGGPTYRVK